MLRVMFLCMVLLAIARLPALAAGPATVAGPCSAASALTAVADALTTGSDANVLAAALASQKRLTACGNERDAIGAELIAADAYGDVNAPRARCAALRDAARRLQKIGDMQRARRTSAVAASCSR